MTEFTDPLFVIGDLGQLESSPGGAIILPDTPNGPGGPSAFIGGYGQLDTRYTFLKDLVTGYVGRVPAFLWGDQMLSLQVVPMAHQTNTIAVAQTLSSGVPMSLVSSAPAQGIAINIPIVPFTGILNSLGTGVSVTTAPIVLDFGFGWCGTNSGNSVVSVADSTLYTAGMPLVIAGVGNSGGTLPLLTNVVSIPSGTSTIQVGPNLPLATNAQTQIGTGNAWGPSEFASSQPNSPYPIPTAHLPYIALGPGLFLDPRQSLTRAIAITTVGTFSTGTLTISGWDQYWAPVTQLISFTSATAASTTYSIKTFKAINSIIPNVTDGHNWSVGTADVFGLPIKTDIAELSSIWWAGTAMQSTTGFTVPDFTTPATSTTGDVRGTIQMGATGSLASGYAGGASNGTVSSGSLTVTGSRLVVYCSLSTWNQLSSRITTPQYQTGRTPA